jgi:tyrosyl-tRNA synthetase
MGSLLIEVILGRVRFLQITMEIKLVNSKSEARRLIEGGGLKLNQIKVEAWDQDLNLKSGDIIQAGKRKFAKIK